MGRQCGFWRGGWLSLLLIFTCFLAGRAQGAPDTIVIQGKLTGASGRALTGTRLWRVQFWNAPADGQAVGAALTGSVSVAASGRFSIELAPPAAALAAASLYYELAVDSASTPDGRIDLADVFPGRVKVASVLFAQNAGLLGGQPANVFVTTASLAAKGFVAAPSLAAAGGPAVAWSNLTGVPQSLAQQGPGSGLNADLLDGLHANVLVTTTSLAAKLSTPGGVRVAWSNLAGVPSPLGTITGVAAGSGLNGGGTSGTVTLGVAWGGTGSAPAAARADHLHQLGELAGDAFVIVKTTSDTLKNGLNLLDAYGRARVLKPNGQPLSAGNRAVLLVPPGRYDLGTSGSLKLDTECVDVAGLSTIPQDQYIIGHLTGVTGSGVLRQTANDVHLENLRADCMRSGSVSLNSNDPAAYFPDSGTTRTVVRNCVFGDSAGSWCTRLGVAYPGSYENVRAVGGGMCFLGGGNGTASGTFKDCTGGDGSFSGTVSGTFTNCTGGDGSFGGTVSGTFTNCTGGDRSFGYTASGTFKDCTGGDESFGGDYGTASGTFTNCTGGINSFGGYYGMASGTFAGCTGGNWSFGSFSGTASGTFTNCTGGYASFGGESGTASGTFTNCTGGSFAFGGYGGTASGTFTNCTGGPSAFGGDNNNVLAKTASAKLKGCRMTGTAWSGTFAGKMEDCQWATGLTLGGSARVYRSTFLGTLTLSGLTVGVAQSCAQVLSGTNIFGANAGNVISLNVN